MKKRKVMIVDDEENFLKIAKINLEETGKYTVMTLPSAKDILAQVKTFKPDIILLDILMPHMDGVEACKILNKDPIGSQIPIIALSALDADKDKLMMYKLGVVDFVIKPVERNTLIAKIEKALQFK